NQGDGLMGLGFDALNQIPGVVNDGGDGFVVGASWVDGVGVDLFAFYFGFDGVGGEVGKFMVGGVDEGVIVGDVGYIPLSSETYWEFSIKGSMYSINNNNGSKSNSYPLSRKVQNAVADTGTTLIYLEAVIADAINNAIGARPFNKTEGVYRIDCGIGGTGPDVNLEFGGLVFLLGARDYVVNLGGICVSGFTQGAGGTVPVVLGDVFLRAYVSVFDKKNARVGFVLAKRGEVESSSSGGGEKSVASVGESTSTASLTVSPTTTATTACTKGKVFTTKSV
ncbi:hypothetical protein HDU76_009382, partial [Blyttiomyces sp. JEL0837]